MCNILKKSASKMAKRKKETKMKKIISIALALVMALGVCFAFASCGDNGDNPPAPVVNKNIGVQSGTTGYYFVKGDAEWEFDGIAGFTPKAYSNGGLAVTDMKNGNIDYVIIDQQPAWSLTNSVAGIKVIDIPLTVEEYAFGVDKAQPELKASINQILADMKTNGKLEEIIQAYATETGIVPITSAVYDESKADTQLVVATNAAFAPFEYKIGDQFAGIDMAIAKHIADTLEMELVIKDMEFDSVVTSVGSNGIDVAMAGLTVNEKRKESVDFTESYYNAAQVVVVLVGNEDFDNCETAEDVLAVFAAKNS